MSSAPTAAGSSAEIIHPPGTYLTVHSTSRDDLNGRTGRVLDASSDSARYKIQVFSSVSAILSGTSPPSQILSLRPLKLKPASLTERVGAMTQYYSHDLRSKINSPQGKALRNEASRALGQIRGSLPSWMTLRMFLIIITLMLVMTVRILGFMKVIILLSLVYMTLMVAYPDIVMSGGSFKERVQRALLMFPTRLRYAIGEMSGYRNISSRVAIIIYVVFVALCLMVVFASTAPSAQIPPVSTASDLTASSAQIPPVSTASDLMSSPSLSSEAIYKLGYEDATSGRDYGSSLPLSQPDDIYEDYPLHPPMTSPTKGSKFGIGNIMSMLYIGRTIQSLAVGPNGVASIGNFVQNLRSQQPLQIGLFALSVYRIVNSVL